MASKQQKSFWLIAIWLALTATLLVGRLDCSQNKSAEEQETSEEDNDDDEQDSSVNDEEQSWSNGTNYLTYLYKDANLAKDIEDYLNSVPMGPSFRRRAYTIYLSGGEQVMQQPMQLQQWGAGPVMQQALTLVQKQSARQVCPQYQCGACPPVFHGKCKPCPAWPCQSCAPCALPDSCAPPAPGKHCPPEIKCNKCGRAAVSSLLNNTSGSSDDDEHSFERVVANIFPDRKRRAQLIALFNEVPKSTGGEEMKLARQIAARLGHRRKEPTGSFANQSRRFTHYDARRNAKIIMADAMTRAMRSKCNCIACPTQNFCTDCQSKANCLHSDRSNCPPCPPAPAFCPAPSHCPKVSPCPECGGSAIGQRPPPPAPPSAQATQCVGAACARQSSCGLAPLNRLTPTGGQAGYIVNGQDQNYGDWPQYVRLTVQVPGQASMSFCGGVLVSDRQVLTAAHCLFIGQGANKQRALASYFTVYLADNSVSQRDQFEERRSVAHVCTSPNYDDSGPVVFDYGVLTLSQPVQFSDHIQPACLPYTPIDYASSKCFVVGLGAISMRGGQPTFAERVQMMRITRVACSRSWGINEPDASRHCWTKYADAGDTCGGDSGGPILCLSRDKRWTVDALVSYGSMRCDGTENPGWVGVYTNVPALLGQITSSCLH